MVSGPTTQHLRPLLCHENSSVFSTWKAAVGSAMIPATRQHATIPFSLCGMTGRESCCRSVAHKTNNKVLSVGRASSELACYVPSVPALCTFLHALFHPTSIISSFDLPLYSHHLPRGRNLQLFRAESLKASLLQSDES